MENHEWVQCEPYKYELPCNTAGFKCMICCNDNNDCVYLCRNTGMASKLDLYKNVWTKVVEGGLNWRANKGLLWMENGKLLKSLEHDGYITWHDDKEGFVVQTLDLRENKKKWMGQKIKIEGMRSDQTFMTLW